MGIENLKEARQKMPEVLRVTHEKIKSVINSSRDSLIVILRNRQQDVKTDEKSSAEVVQEYVDATSNPPLELDSAKTADLMSQQIFNANVPEEVRESFKNQMSGIGG